MTVSLFLLCFKGKRRHRRPRWSNIRTKRRKLNEGGEVEDRGRKREEGESEGGSDSEESYKSEEIPSEDACSQCGLPNHPELVREEHVCLYYRLFYYLIVHMKIIWTPLSSYIWVLSVWGCFVMIWATGKNYASSCFGCVM